MDFLFAWNQSFLTDLPSIDEQHERLVHLINDLGELALSKDEIDAACFEEAVDAVLKYAREHFADEEAHMARAGLDERHRREHRAAHRLFMQEAREHAAFAGASPRDRSRRMVEFLVHWLAYHILGVDQGMARQIKAVARGVSPALAYENEVRYVQEGTGPLLVALSGLFQTVSERNRELRELNRQLEERVLDRTRDLEMANTRLEWLSTRDDLTGLPNRRFAVATLQDLWEDAAAGGAPLSVLMIDADGFKSVNDRFGHDAGDDLLRSLAERLRDAVRTSDTVCRLGGDEFLVICPGTTADQATAVAEKILAAAAPFRTPEGNVCWSGALSIGIAEVHAGMRRTEELLKCADEALYAAKHQGGRRARVA